jgi:hypothetical protein
MRRILLLFLAAAPVLSAQSPTCRPLTSAARWYRGNTHAHTTESDGNVAPLEVARWYREHGYDFVFITDHEKITPVEPLNAALGADGKFLVVRGQEVTQRIVDSAHFQRMRQAHVNSLGPATVVIPLGEKTVARGTTVAASYARNIPLIRGAGGVAQVNHPNFRWSVRFQDMTTVPDSTLLEIWNAQPRINNLGGTSDDGEVMLSTEALWDSLLTRGQLLWGVGSDDSHDFKPLDDDTANRPGRAWVTVRADALDSEALTSALHCGRFYSSTGVTLGDIVASDTLLSIAILKPKNDRDEARYSTRFIGRAGRVLAEVTGIAPRYRIRGNEGYVRAVVTDSNGRRAWTQPHMLRTSRRR